ncbi:hypothetical protein [Paenibacillus eucommiae]|uniref:Lipid-A-disaccharide synthase-like uncharacterized protein n=1 Tax=Paenibacillus eucommiae TaxID=1355755 RepID=A0ABS4J9M5_9BACL|nr:hypothetical protein [Paenibacillus eucommiae]MBP1996542.1 lipid-A-disaccharide synthase-like uncharacterized protein [Paenibacillus eucommiae]
MNENSKKGQQDNGSLDWNASLLSLISLAAGIMILWATWFFYKDALDTPGFPWYRWIQPILMVLGGILSLIAAALLLMRRDSGMAVLKTAVGIIPVILALRLLIVIIIFIGKAFDGTIMARLNDITMSPLKITINVAVVVVIILLVQLGKAGKSKSDKAMKEK